MTKQEISEKIHSILYSKLLKEEKKFSPESNFNSVGADFFDIINSTIEIEKEFKTNIPNKIILRFNAFSFIEDYISRVTDFIYNDVNKE